jgi:poly-gamma-glutamate synthesis protein (capsule biosynthesis protein)
VSRRRKFLEHAGGLALAALAPAADAGRTTTMRQDDGMRLFLCGDVMTARGIDQILPHPGDPLLHEGYATSALDYVHLAEARNGPVPRPVGFDDVWGDALAEWARWRPDARIVNLETAITGDGVWQRSKGIHYRMHPANAGVLTAAKLDCCVLANNHVLDWGEAGLDETLATLQRAGIATAGAGRDLAAAAAPAVLATAAGRVLVFAFGLGSSGIPPEWAAAPGRPGVHRLDDLSPATLRRIAALIAGFREPGDRVVASIHWGGNWGYAVPASHQIFARGLIDGCGVDVVHGHSSHHPLGIEVYRGRPILYGCGDFLNDYEGIAGYEAFRADLCLMYFLTLERADGALVRLDMIPLRMRRLRLERAATADAAWLATVLDRESARFGCRVTQAASGALELRWPR